MTSIRFKVATCNLMELPRHDKTVGTDIARVVGTGAGIVLWQEAANAYYKAKLRAIVRLKTLVIKPGTDFDVPISYDSKLFVPVAGRSAIKIQDGWAKVTPNRYMASQTFAVRANPSMKFVVRNSHPIAGAWDARGGSNRPGKDRPRRRREWLRARTIIMARVRASALRGTPQIVGGDTNRHRLGFDIPAKVAGRRVQKVYDGFDFLYFIDGRKFKWTLIGKPQVLNTNSDHDTVVQNVSLAG